MHAMTCAGPTKDTAIEIKREAVFGRRGGTRSMDCPTLNCPLRYASRIQKHGRRWPSLGVVTARRHDPTRATPSGVAQLLRRILLLKSRAYVAAVACSTIAARSRASAMRYPPGTSS
jgi:hypothetical protein